MCILNGRFSMEDDRIPVKSDPVIPPRKRGEKSETAPRERNYAEGGKIWDLLTILFPVFPSIPS